MIDRMAMKGKSHNPRRITSTGHNTALHKPHGIEKTGLLARKSVYLVNIENVLKTVQYA